MNLDLLFSIDSQLVLFGTLGYFQYILYQTELLSGIHEVYGAWDAFLEHG